MFALCMRHEICHSWFYWAQTICFEPDGQIQIPSYLGFDDVDKANIAIHCYDFHCIQCQRQFYFLYEFNVKRCSLHLAI
jgi:hypothetical protein